MYKCIYINVLPIQTYTYIHMCMLRQCKLDGMCLMCCECYQCIRRCV